jgi:hypothetical protein
MYSLSDTLEEGSDGSHALSWGESGGVPSEERFEGKGEAGSQIGEKAMVVVVLWRKRV